MYNSTVASKPSSNSAVLFTLPVSCHVCLGKVKQPVICPNQHVFCKLCLDVWLARNAHCPACRVPITADNPYRSVLGGLVCNDNNGSLESRETSREVRHARWEILCREYEADINHLEEENILLKRENETLRVSMKNSASVDVLSSPTASNTSQDKKIVAKLSKKLEDANELYEQVKKEIDRLKQENSNLRDLNNSLTLENKTLKMEVSSRSPRKYGRYTVAALESQLENSEREVTHLKRALERSDAHIEELEKRLRSAGLNPIHHQDILDELEPPSKYTNSSVSVLEQPSEGSSLLQNDAEHCFDEESNMLSESAAKDDLESTLELPSTKRDRISASKKPQHSVKKFKKEESSLSTNIEFPSPMLSAISAASTSLLSIDQSSECSSEIDDSLLTGNDRKRNRYSQSAVNCRRNLSAELNIVDDVEDEWSKKLTVKAEKNILQLPSYDELELPQPTTSKKATGKKLANTHMPAIKSPSMEHPSKLPGRSKAVVTFDLLSAAPSSTKERNEQYNPQNRANGFNTYQALLEEERSNYGDANISLTPELEDCLRIFDEAERKVGQRKLLMSADSANINTRGSGRTGAVDSVRKT